MQVVRLLSCLVVFGLFVSSLLAQAGNFGNSKPYVSSAEGLGSLRKVQLPPLYLGAGTKLTLSSPPEWQDVAKEFSKVLKTTYGRFNDLFGDIPAFTTSLKIMDEESFYLSTGAPRWTNAMYYRDQIVIPLSEEALKDTDNLYRSIKHEFTHAVIHALSGGKCPGWLDEGFAQWAEGSENPALKPALLNWLDDRPPVPLAFLQGGFTKLDSDMVPAAYAQSLFAANTVMNSYGFRKIARYFATLRAGARKNDAFTKSFGVSEARFEQHLSHTLEQWSEEMH